MHSGRDGGDVLDSWDSVDDDVKEVGLEEASCGEDQRQLKRRDPILPPEHAVHGRRFLVEALVRATRSASTS